MRVYGYESKSKVVSKIGLLELKEVTISANPDVLRKMADFIVLCANAMEKDPRWSHNHFKIDGKNTPEFIIYNPRAN